MTEMTKADRANLERLARKRAKVATSMIAERVKVLRAGIEDQLAAEHSIDDELWADLNRQARQAVAKADAAIAARCAQLGIAENLRPSIHLSWRGRGDNALAERRTELRRLAFARIDAAAESAKVTISVNLLEVETELIRDGLETADATAFVLSMPTVEQLLPPIDVAALPAPRSDDTDDEADLRLWALRQRGGGWEPPVGAVGELLTPTSASGLEAKRAAIASALASNPSGSNREIARVAGVDHHTVAKHRGESPAAGGDSPGDADGPGAA